MKTYAETVIVGRTVKDPENIRKDENEEPLFKVQVAHTIEGLAEGVQSTFWYTALFKSEKLAESMKKGTAVMIRGQIVPNVYEAQVNYTFRSANITLLERPIPVAEPS